jgi:Flp pilus assembly protein TadG
VELVILAPIVIVFVLLSLALGRYELARDQVVGGARAAAQAAAVSISLDQARLAALAAALPALQSLHSCQDPTVEVDSDTFVPGAIVRVVVSCRVDLSDLLIPGMSGVTTVSSVQTAVIDPYRMVGQ